MIVIEKKSNVKSSENAKKKCSTDWDEKVQGKKEVGVQMCLFPYDT